MGEFQCSRCAADPKPAGFGDPRHCAFRADGSFNPENWNCATIDALLGKDHVHITGHDEQFEATPTHLDDDDHTGGWVITTRYKRRGCTSSAIYVGDCDPILLTLELAELVIASRESHQQWRDSQRAHENALRDQFRERVADLMIKHGPDRHCDGYEIIADTLWEEFKLP